MSAKIANIRRNYALHRFAKSEEGAMIMLGLIFFTLMVMMGGLAVDMMRFETTRTQLQQTTDRAVLAAASMRQTVDPDVVVRDYFTKAGLIDNLKTVNVVKSLNSRQVQVYAQADLQPFFMQMMGVTSLKAPANSSATEKITDVEISMVLDISGSMNTNSKIANLRNAAKEFVDTIFASAQPDRTTISIIPYSMQVNLGDKLSSVYNMPRVQTQSYCADLPDTSYTATNISQTTLIQQTGHFDAQTGSGTRAPSSYVCNTSANLTVTPFTDDVTYLKSRIGLLVAGGNTSIDLGMKWGTALLDPAGQGVVTSLIANGTVSSRFAGRPLDPATRDVLKVVILMTDGENTDQYALKDPYQSGTSNIYKRNSDNKLASYYDRSGTTSDYYSPDDYDAVKKTYGVWYTQPFNSSSGWTQLTWPQVWATATVNYVAQTLFATPRAQTYSTWQGNFRTAANKATKDARLHNICVAAKAKGITVFSIGFADSAGQQVSGKAQLLDCASVPGNYYDVAGLEISTAFRSIASQISNLRLTQ